MNHDQAKALTKLNANSTGEVWCYFCDTSGNWRNERYRGQDLISWSGVHLTLVYPDDLKVRFIPRVNSELEAWDILDMLNTCGTEEREPTVPMTVWDEAFVQPAVDWLNRAHMTYVLANKAPETIEPGEERPFEIKHRGPKKE